MRVSLRFPGSLAAIILLAGIIPGCSDGDMAGTPPPTGSGGASAAGGQGGSVSGGNSGQEGTGGKAEGGASGSEPDADVTAEGGTEETGDGGVADAGPTTGTDYGPNPTYDGEIAMYQGPPVGPEVKMDCPGDPTEGWTEYQDTFHVERPYNVPINTRFSIEGGIYNFWVFPNDKPHSTGTRARNPRTEARFGNTFDKATGGEFTTGMRMWSADVLLEASANHSVIMQVHTTTTGIGPVYLVLEDGDIPPIKGSSVPGGLVDKWFNMKVAFNADKLQSQLYINNCLKATITGRRGDGHFYFKNGVYHCGDSGGCRDHYKNLHLYQKATQS
jgi:hypothetical protein